MEEKQFSKLVQWDQFSAFVRQHIAEYVIPQYGDFPDKTIAKFNPVKIQGKLEAYNDRIGTSSRGLEDMLRDCFKCAHFQCYLFSLLKFGNAQANLLTDIEK